jgi:uncharacterized membrane protein
MLATILNTGVKSMPKLLSIAAIVAIAIGGWMPVSNSAQPVQKMQVFGNEPFWSLQVSQRGFIYQTPEVGKRKISNYVSPLKALGRPADALKVYRMQNNNTLIIQKESCSDGMSDNTHAYSAVLIMGRKVLSGCARLEN